MSTAVSSQSCRRRLFMTAAMPKRTRNSAGSSRRWKRRTFSRTPRFRGTRRKIRGTTRRCAAQSAACSKSETSTTATPAQCRAAVTAAAKGGEKQHSEASHPYATTLHGSHPISAARCRPSAAWRAAALYTEARGCLFFSRDVDATQVATTVDTTWRH